MAFHHRLASILLVLGTLWQVAAGAQDFSVPPLQGPVNDYADILDPQAERSLDSALRSLRSQTGTQIAVLTVPSLGGLPIEQASIKVVESWQLGTKKEDRGALLLVAPNDRKVRIEVGQGLEGELTDLDSKRIIDGTILPLFRQGDFPGGVISGVYQMTRKTDPQVDLTAEFEGIKPTSEVARRGGRPSPLFFIVAMFVLAMFLSGGGRGGGRRFRRGVYYGGLGGLGGWGGGGRGGGGGWSGGGGGFSGGGASGGW